jgi:hypothetical protein
VVANLPRREHRFLDTSDLYNPSLGIIARVFPASGSGAFGSSRLTGDVRLAGDLALSRTVSLNPNVGIGRFERAHGGAVGVALLALTLAWQPAIRTHQPFVDHHVPWDASTTRQASRCSSTPASRIISPNIQLDLSYGDRRADPGRGRSSRSGSVFDRDGERFRVACSIATRDFEATRACWGARGREGAERCYTQPKTPPPE